MEKSVQSMGEIGERLEYIRRRRRNYRSREIIPVFQNPLFWRWLLPWSTLYVCSLRPHQMSRRKTNSDPCPKDP